MARAPLEPFGRARIVKLATWWPSSRWARQSASLLSDFLSGYLFCFSFMDDEGFNIWLCPFFVQLTASMGFALWMVDVETETPPNQAKLRRGGANVTWAAAKFHIVTPCYGLFRISIHVNVYMYIICTCIFSMYCTTTYIHMVTRYRNIQSNWKMRETKAIMVHMLVFWYKDRWFSNSCSHEFSVRS